MKRKVGSSVSSSPSPNTPKFTSLPRPSLRPVNACIVVSSPSRASSMPGSKSPSARLLMKVPSTSNSSSTAPSSLRSPNRSLCLPPNMNRGSSLIARRPNSSDCTVPPSTSSGRSGSRDCRGGALWKLSSSSYMFSRGMESRGAGMFGPSSTSGRSRAEWRVR